MDQTLNSFISYVNNSSELSLDIIGYCEVLFVSLGCGLAIKFLYFMYFRDNEPQDGSLARSLVLITPTLTTIFYLIQSSIVLSLGLLGSMAFVRFRTPVKRSEDVTFIVIALAIAVSCSTKSFPIAFILISMFLVFTLVRNYFGDGIAKRGRSAIVTFNTKSKKISVKETVAALASHDLKVDFVSSRTYDGICSYVFNVARLIDTSHDQVKKTLESLDDQAHINIFYPNERLGA